MPAVPPVDEWRTLTATAARLLREGQPHDALQLLQRAERKAPLERDVRYWLGNACRATGQTERAERLFRTLLSERAGDFEVSFALAFLLRDSGAPNDAAEALLAASRQPGLTDSQMLQIAGFLRETNRFDGAIEVCERLVERRPEQADLHFKLARLYQVSGDFEQARRLLQRTLDLDPTIGPAWVSLAQQTRLESADDEDFRRILEATQQRLGHEADMCIAFAAGKALDDLGRWPEAWVQYVRGNRLMRAAQAWNPRAWVDFVDRASNRSLNAGGASGASNRRAVFIVGMPRSGTTLLERMLSRHPEIRGRGELNFLSQLAEQRARSGAWTPAQLREAAELLWTQLRLDDPESGTYVDKNPLNFRYLDVLFDILPGARVIHLERDGRASGLSCYFQLFKHSDMGFSYDCEDLVQFYSGYRRLMAHWERSFPARILRLRYEDLVHSPTNALSRVLGFLDLDWNEAVTATGGSRGPVRTASLWQARQPVHAESTDRWRHYHDRAPDFFDRLAAIDEKYLSADSADNADKEKNKK